MSKKGRTKSNLLQKKKRKKFISQEECLNTSQGTFILHNKMPEMRLSKWEKLSKVSQELEIWKSNIQLTWISKLYNNLKKDVLESTKMKKRILFVLDFLIWNSVVVKWHKCFTNILLKKLFLEFWLVNSILLLTPKLFWNLESLMFLMFLLKNTQKDLIISVTKLLQKEKSEGFFSYKNVWL